MDKKKIKQTDWKKILTKMAVSLGLLMVVILVLINTITQYPDVAVPLAITLLFLLSGYWIYLGLSKKNKLYLSFDEFKKKYPDHPDSFFVDILKKNDYSDEEICELLNVKDINEVNSLNSKISVNDGGLTLLIGIIICVAFGIYVGIGTNSFGSGLLGSIYIGVIVMPIAYSIASYQAHKHKMNTVLPVILDKIEEQGYSIKNQYISSNGNGVVIDPDKHIVAVVTILKDEPLILQSYNILDCEMNTEKAYSINSSDAGTTGMLLGNEGFKELGKYDSRDITEFYTHIDVNITVSDGTRSTVLTIPLINEKIVTYVANEQLYLAKDIVNNIKMLLEHSFEDMKRDISKNMDDTLDIILKDLEKQTGLEYEREVLKEFLSVTDKFKTKDFVAYNLIRVLVEDNSQDENSNIKLDKEVVLELSKYWAKLSDEEREGEKLLNKYIKLYNYKHKPTAKDNISNLDEIKKLKELLDMRAITKEEYNKKKKELLK